MRICIVVAVNNTQKYFRVKRQKGQGREAYLMEDFLGLPSFLGRAIRLYLLRRLRRIPLLSLSLKVFGESLAGHGLDKWF
ncbi:hypothetical protein C943_03320 [Mariniradius saccharolyticus AK6]|uniref:Uncharacterized protein n=1 Tax=Mariniradius saccharolyticus AK6 TaxID=1239962 RepID=M7XJ90_9BACT|nr:hypothetical protein [Mariniradius saccharolyticus]EMS34633.1 hypothetical protein C943_03320 [Mariniradius saccharolyticus AK6]